ncbi:MAG: glycosyltransferase [Paracoccaceae bacterium]
MSAKIICDLTELTTVKTGRFQYYGIAKTVAEIAEKFAANYRDVRFVVYSVDFQEFFEVHPIISDDPSENIDLNVPDFEIFKFRRKFHAKNPERHLVSILGPFVSWNNRRRIKATGYRFVPADMRGAKLFSAARPKLMVDMIRTIKRRKLNTTFHPLLHDLIPLHDLGGHTRKSFPFNMFYDSKYVIENTDQMITNSQFTLDDIARFANDGRFVMPKSTAAVPLVHECFEGTEEPVIKVPNTPYFLAVGSLLGRKNLNVVFDAMVLMQKSGRTVPKLILAGTKRKHISRALKSGKWAVIAPFVEQIHSPNQTDLVRLYRSAVAVLMPSRIEGWGLPAGEALWFGIPAICSTAPVLKEVCGDLGLYFDPDDPQELVTHMDRLLDDPGFRGDLCKRIEAKKSTFRTWADVAHDVYESMENY